MGKGFQGAVLALLGSREHHAEVLAVHEVTESVLRVDFRCPDLLSPAGELPAAWVRAWFPDPDGGAKLHQRAYTLLDPVPEAGTFSLAFVRHQPGGPAVAWAEAAQPGQTLILQRLGGGGFTPPEPAPPGYLLIGDAASWPAISAIAAEIRGRAPVRILMEAHHPADRRLPLPEGDGISVDWVDTRDDDRALVEALSGGDYRGWSAWVAAETRVTRLVRTALQVDHGQNRESMHTQAYWIRGRAMGRSLEVPEEHPAATTSAAAPGGAGTPDTDTVVREAADGNRGRDASVLRPARPVLILGGVATAILAVAQLVPLILLTELATALLAGADRVKLTGLAVAGVVTLLLLAGVEAVLIAVLHVFDAAFAAGLRRRLLRKMTRLPLGWFRGVDAGDARELLKDDVDALHYLVTHAVPDVVGAITAPIAILVYLCTVDLRLTAALLLPVLGYLVVMGRRAAADRAAMAEVLRWDGLVAAAADRFIRHQDTARIFGAGLVADLPGMLDRRNLRLMVWQWSSLPAKSAALQLTRPQTMLGILCLGGAALATAGRGETAQLLPFLILGTSFGDRLVAASYSANGLREGLSAVSALELFLTTPELPRGRPGDATAPPPDTAPEVRFDTVGFGYRADCGVLDGVSMTLPAGRTTALVGPSGAGKSTLAALLARLWDPDSGRILLDGRDLRDLPEPELRATIAAVLQDAQLIHGTLRDNIRLGAPEATDAEVSRACAIAQVTEFAGELPRGLDTQVDRVSLSGGQRQRVGLARVLLGHPKVIVLDEALASADAHTERAIQDALGTALAGRTVLVIAHRMSTIAEADHIVVLDRGTVVEQGSREELLAAGGAFHTMIERNRRVLP